MGTKKLLLGAATLLFAAWLLKGHFSVNQTLDLVKVRIGTKKVLPDPAKIETTGDWYFLDHISSGLVSYDHEKNIFVPNIAQGWDIAKGRVHTFKLRKDLKFSDGTSITPDDVLVSIKRILVKKTSTHLPLWNYIEGCEKLTTLEDECAGLRLNENKDLEITLKTLSESFFLQLASPETGIWAKSEIDPKDLSIKPTRFSGPYKIVTTTESGFLLERNEHSLISQKFEQSPRKIELVSIPIGQAEEELAQGKIDLLLRSHNPFAERNWGLSKITVNKTAPSTIVYLHSVHNTAPLKLIGQDLIQALWKSKADEAIPATTFLPFAANYSLKQGDFLNCLPAHSAKKIRIGKPWTFYSDQFISLLTDAARSIGVELEMVHLEAKEWSQAFEDPKAHEKIDFILSPYVASERYPAVQLRFLTGQMKKSPVDLMAAESPDLTPEKIEVLKSYQKWLLESQSAVPLFFTRMQLYHKADIDLGAQSKTDGEVELWRLTRKEP